MTCGQREAGGGKREANIFGVIDLDGWGDLGEGTEWIDWDDAEILNPKFYILSECLPKSCIPDTQLLNPKS